MQPFRYYTKLEAKRDKLVQLMQQFVPRCFVRIFHNECSRSTPLDPKLMFWCVSFRLGAFGTVSLQHETCCKTRQTGESNAKVRATKSCCNFFASNAPDPPHWPLNSFFGVFHIVWVHLRSFRNCMKLGAKRGELQQLMQKFVTRSHVGIFRNECTQSTPLDPKLMFRCVS